MMKHIIHLCAILTFGNAIPPQNPPPQHMPPPQYIPPQNPPPQYIPLPQYIPPAQYIPIPGYNNAIFPSDSIHMTLPDQMIMKQSQRLCSNKRCCRALDDTSMFQTTCTNKGYLECLAETNNCVWDCHTPGSYPRNAHREFRGINKRQGVGSQPLSKEETFRYVDIPEINNQIPGYYTMDECATTYEVPSQNAFPDKLGAEGRDINEYNRRRLAVFGVDGRVNVTDIMTYPYHKNVIILGLSATGEIDHSCSGALISPRHVLTAGNCISDGNGNYYHDWIVIVGLGMEYYGTPVMDKYSVVDTFVFDEFHLTQDVDYNFGILTLTVADAGWGWYGFGYNTNIASTWEFDYSGYQSDNGLVLQRQNFYMDYIPYGIRTHQMVTKTGDATPRGTGGPLWYTGDIKPKIYGVLSHFKLIGGVEVGNAFARLTAGKVAAICDYIHTFPQTSDHCTTATV